MAVDEALLASTAESGTAVLRLYAWSEPTLSLGYFQRFADRGNHAASRDCPVVRRMSGGGAILHDQESTYCLLLPAVHPLAAHPEQLYSLAHSLVVEMIGETAASLVEQPSSAQGVAEPFLCFQRRSAGDLVVDRAKVLGSAQRRRHGVIMQHGSLLTSRSRYAPELPGLFDLRPELAGQTAEPWLEVWAGRFAESLGFALNSSELTTSERADAERLVGEKYAAAAWTQRR
jgi:lipoate-protein ligase A